MNNKNYTDQSYGLDKNLAVNFDKETGETIIFNRYSDKQVRLSKEASINLKRLICDSWE